MARRETEPIADEGISNAWMSTFSDLLMLMLTFFVLLLTMSSLDDQSVRALKRSGVQLEPVDTRDAMMETVIVVKDEQVSEAIAAVRKELEAPAVARNVPRIHALMTSLLDAAGVNGPSWVEIRPDGVLVHVDGGVVFEEGSAELTPAAKKFLGSFAGVVVNSNRNVAVNAFVAGGKTYAEADADWDLALLRADHVAKHLIGAEVREERLRVMGYGYAAGREEQRFLRQSNLLRLQVITGDSNAEPASGE